MPKSSRPKEEFGAPAATSSAESTRDKILSSAEFLFGEHGFAGTSLRSIIARADVNLAAVHYHFGSKEGLIVEVLGRIVRPIITERLRLLDELESRPKSMTIERVLHCFVDPPFRMAPLHQSASRKLISRLHHDSDPEIEQRMVELFGPMMDRFVQALTKLLPHLSRADVVRRVHFAVGAMLFTMSHPQRLGIQSQSTDETVGQIVGFLVGGFSAPSSETAASGSGPQRKKPSSRKPK